jgi:hypothetical protein
VINVISRNSWTQCGVGFSSVPQNELEELDRWLAEHPPQQQDDVISTGRQPAAN